MNSMHLGEIIPCQHSGDLRGARLAMDAKSVWLRSLSNTEQHLLYQPGLEAKIAADAELRKKIADQDRDVEYWATKRTRLNREVKEMVS